MGLLGKVAKTSGGLLDEAGGYVKDLMFLHNTNSDKIARQQGMGGMPMPSVAVTQKDIPFDSFGDITLVGKPSNFDPKASKLNQAFSADAYTVRAPQPLRIAKKGAGSNFDNKYGAKLKDLGVYTDEVSSNIWGLERKGDANPSKYRHVSDFFEDRAGALYLEENGIKYKGSLGPIGLKKKRVFEQKAIDKARTSGDLQSWSKGKADEIFEPEEYFISNPDRDYYTTGARLKPYDADEVAKFMKRSAGRNTEGGMSSSSAGAVRASTTEQFQDLQGMRNIKDRLVSSDEMAEFKQTTGMMLDDLSEDFKSNYKYQSDHWGYNDEFREFIQLSESKGVKAAANKVGFDPSDELIQRLNEYKDMLRGGPTEYFESKPKRVVDFSEFSGAIVPKNTDKATIGLLESYGIKVKKYANEDGRLAARDKFKSEMFSNPAAGVGAGVLGAIGASQSNNTYADYSPANLARLRNNDVGSIQAPQSMAASNIAGLMGSANKVGYDDSLLGMVAPQLPSELMNKIAYNDKRGLMDYAKAYAGLLGF